MFSWHMTPNEWTSRLVRFPIWVFDFTTLGIQTICLLIWSAVHTATLYHISVKVPTFIETRFLSFPIQSVQGTGLLASVHTYNSWCGFGFAFRSQRTGNEGSSFSNSAHLDANCLGSIRFVSLWISNGHSFTCCLLRVITPWTSQLESMESMHGQRCRQKTCSGWSRMLRMGIPGHTGVIHSHTWFNTLFIDHNFQIFSTIWIIFIFLRYIIL